MGQGQGKMGTPSRFLHTGDNETQRSRDHQALEKYSQIEFACFPPSPLFLKSLRTLRGLRRDTAGRYAREFLLILIVPGY